MKQNLITTTLLASIIPALAGTESNMSEHPLSTLDSQADHSQHSNHDHGSIPVGLMDVHIHDKGDFMLSYRYMFMDMQDNFNGSNRQSDRSVRNDSGFAVSPTEMQMEMHMIGAMYGVTDKLTLMGMVNIVNVEMNHQTRSGATFKTKSSGLGDSSIAALYQFVENERSSLHAGIGLNLPTAETDEEDFIPLLMRESTLPFPMQLGSGSWGIRPSITYLGHHNQLSWGAQLMANIHLDDNDSGYRLGNTLSANLWGSYSITDNFSTSLRLEGSSWGNIDGTHEDFEIPLVGIVPTVVSNLRGGERVDLFLGASYALGNSPLRLSAEIGKPLWQDLDGPQLGLDWSANFGISASF